MHPLLLASSPIVRAARRFELWPASSTAADYRWTGCVPIVIACAGWLMIACTRFSGAGTHLPYIPLLNPFDLAALLVLHACWKWSESEAEANQAEETPNKSELWFDTFPVRPE